MGRVLAGIVAANLAAPCLLLLFAGLYGLLVGPDPFFPLTRTSVVVAAIIFYAVTILVLKTTLPASLVLAVIGKAMGWHSLWIHLFGAAALGLGFAFFLSDWTLPRRPVDQRLFLLSLGIGIICGWIYWRIAIRRTPEALHAIAKP